MAGTPDPFEAKARRWVRRNNLTADKVRSPKPGVVHVRATRQVDPTTTESMTLTFKRGKHGTVRVWDPLDGWITGKPRQVAQAARPIYRRTKR